MALNFSRRVAVLLCLVAVVATAQPVLSKVNEHACDVDDTHKVERARELR